MNPIHILLVEDNEGDIILTMGALNKGGAKNIISIARDGEQAIQFLNKEGAYIHAERPNLILPDITLPRVDGNDVLIYIKSSPELSTIPVIMLTTSTSEKDVLVSYKNYANCYISKPVNLDRFFEVVEKFEDFWISIVQLPKKV